jgi:hypothetical protein
VNLEKAYVLAALVLAGIALLLLWAPTLPRAPF